ncbi:MAG: hypothetical protein JXN60_04675 [Lentisphaerae bacterium]|nr:hypothetical protein [Lentisphaerota bacterium]
MIPDLTELNSFHWIIIISAVMFVITLVIVPLICIHMPENYFAFNGTESLVKPRQQITLKLLIVVVLKNLLGLILLLVGAVMIALPGQGILTLLVGIILLDLPGKRALEKSIARKHIVQRIITRIRAKAGKSPLRFPGVMPTSDRILETDTDT